MAWLRGRGGEEAHYGVGMVSVKGLVSELWGRWNGEILRRQGWLGLWIEV